MNWSSNAAKSLQCQLIHASGLHMCSFCPTASIRMYESHFSHNKRGNIYIFMLNYIEHYWNVRIENSEINKGRACEGAGVYFASRLHREDYKRCNKIVRYKNYKCSNLTLMVSHTRPGKLYSVRLKVQQNRPEFMYSPSMYACVNIHLKICLGVSTLTIALAYASEFRLKVTASNATLMTWLS